MILPSAVIHYQGKFVRCYDGRDGIAPPRVNTVPEVIMNFWRDATDNDIFGCSLAVDGKTVVDNAQLCIIVGRKYPDVRHYFVLGKGAVDGRRAAGGI